jgi:hypothetical protein
MCSIFYKGSRVLNFGCKLSTSGSLFDRCDHRPALPHSGYNWRDLRKAITRCGASATSPACVLQQRIPDAQDCLRAALLIEPTLARHDLSDPAALRGPNLTAILNPTKDAGSNWQKPLYPEIPTEYGSDLSDL